MGTQIALGQPGSAPAQEEGCLEGEFCSLPETSPPVTPRLEWTKYSLTSSFRKSNSENKGSAPGTTRPPGPEPLRCHCWNPQHQA